MNRVRRPGRLLLLLTLLLTVLGCQGQHSAASEEAAASLLRKTLVHDGRNRIYYEWIPEVAAPPQGYGLNLVLHGGFGNPLHMAGKTGFHKMDNPVPTIVVYPAGSGRFEERLLTWNAGLCCGYAQRKNIDDVGFLAQLIEQLRRDYPIDPQRITVSGHSNGGMMAYRMACERADLVRAIGVVSGTMDLSAKRCHPSRPVSVFHIHGEADQNVPVQGGMGEKSRAGVAHRSLAETLALWRGYDHCVQTPEHRDDGKVSVDRYSCEQGSQVWEILVHDGPHQWEMNGLYDATSALVNAFADR